MLACSTPTGPSSYYFVQLNLCIYLFLVITSYMYFSNWYKSPRIERAMLDGTNRIPLISHTGRVNGLTIDFQEQRLYWASVDSRIIESSNLLGEDRHEVVRGLMHPFSLTQYQDFIYWADWNSKSIERANKTNGQNRTKVQEKMDFIMDILIFHNSRQSGLSFLVSI